MKSVGNILSTLKEACQLLDINEGQQLKADISFICGQLSNPKYRIAVLARVNYGKSTLLDAMLGNKILPIKPIRATGAASVIRYGEVPATKIRLKSGRVVTKVGEPEVLKALEEFITLKEEESLKNNIVFVEVLYPYYFLKENNVELIDLPGTDDSDEQDNLIRSELLRVDLVLQVINAKQPLPRSELDQLQTWLVQRGITNVLFVLNRMNLLTEDERNKVYQSIISEIEKFPSKFPRSIKKIYRVDAQPARRARLRIGGISEQDAEQREKESGIIEFESALSSIVREQRQQIYESRIPRIHVVSKLLVQLIKEKANRVKSKIVSLQASLKIKQSLYKIFRSLKDYFSYKNLEKCYGQEACIAIKSEDEVVLIKQADDSIISVHKIFAAWKSGEFYQSVYNKVKIIDDQLYEIFYFFEREKPSALATTISSWIPSERTKPALPERPEGLGKQPWWYVVDVVKDGWKVGSNVGGVLGGGLFSGADWLASAIDKDTTGNRIVNFLGSAAIRVVGGCAGLVVAAYTGTISGVVTVAGSAIIRPIAKDVQRSAYFDDCERAYREAANTYLLEVSKRALATIAKYEQEIDSIIGFQKPYEISEIESNLKLLKKLELAAEGLEDLELLKPDMVVDKFWYETVFESLVRFMDFLGESFA